MGMHFDHAPTRKDCAFHGLKDSYKDRSFRNALAESRILPQDIDLIMEYVAEYESSRGISKLRVNKVVYTLVNWRRYLGPYLTNTMAEIYKGISNLNSATNKKGQPLKKNTIHDYVLILKCFYRWLIENEYVTLPEKKIRNIRIPPVDSMTKVASDLLTPEEVITMVKVAEKSRDRAIIMVLYEGGFRVGELGQLRWSDVNFDSYGAVVNVNAKTGKPRYIRLVMSVEFLAQWKKDYPFTPEGEALVFLTAARTPLTHGTVDKQLKRIACRAGIKKHITPHIFRHSRITHLIKEGVSESVIKLMMWGNLTTNMFQTYAHLTGNDIDSEILRKYGISAEVKPDAEVKLEPRQCQYCQTINSPISKYCSLCGRPVIEEAVTSQEEVQKFVLSHGDDLKAYIDTRVKYEMRAAQNGHAMG